MELGSSSSRSRSNLLSMALGCEQNKVVNIVLPYALPQNQYLSHSYGNEKFLNVLEIIIVEY